MRRVFVTVLCAFSVSAAWAVAGSGEAEKGALATYPASAGKLIAYSRKANGNAEVFVARSDGSHRRRITDARPQVNNGNSTPAWSPDGRRLAFVAQRDRPLKRPPYWRTRTALFAVRVDGTGGRRVTRWYTRSFVSQPDWSPDGRLIAFNRYANDRLSIMQVPVAGGKPRQVGPYASASPDWSPDGRWMAFTRIEEETGIVGEIWVMRADGSEPRRLAEDGGNPRWSPDGAQIAFESARDRNGETYYDHGTEPNTEVYLMNADGTDQRRLTHGRANDGHPAWSPDGRWIAFDSGRPARINFNHHLWIMRADGSCERRLVPGTAWSSEAAWQPGPLGASFPVPRCG